MNNHVEVAEKLFIDILSKYEFQIHKAYTNTLFELVNQFISWSMEIKLLKI
ncbi:hypothetical protein [Rickettsia sp. Tenjiku01]|uniref:hypothetical protein n=1 Tax=Rickettsia sp. Tenjiku01 TaxID=1736693 RepID=UPI00155E090C|nr:hypothetical protein [Rickettsia sp. Tenjiku01]